MDDKFRPIDASLDDDSTQTIELTDLFTRDLTTTGSFDVGSGIRKTTFGKVIQALPIPTLLVDESFHIVFANQAWKRVSPEYAVTQGLLLSKLFPEAPIAGKIQSLLEDVFSTRKPVVARGTLEVGDSRIWARITFRSIRVMEERLVLLLVEDLTANKQVLEQNKKHRKELEKRVEERTSELLAANAQLKEEVAERKRMEMALRDSEERYRILAENSLTGICVHQDGKFVYINRRAAESLGYSESELIGKSVWELVAPEDREITKGRVAARLQGKQAPFHYQFRALTRNGGIIWVEALATEIEHNGRPATLANVMDITDRKHAEEALRENEALLRSTQQIARVGSWQLDLTTNRLTWSEEVYRIFGVQPEEFPATYEGFLERVHPEDRLAVDAAYSGSLREDRDSYETEHRIVTKDSGEVRHVHEKGGHFRDSTGRIIRSVGMVQDITEHKKAEEDRERLIEQLQQALTEIKRLSGFLPICASCKKIRDDKGYWQQIERYISEHSEALFSHGICPDCAKKLYPHIFADDSTPHKPVSE